jgi:hypothetical protein
MKPRLATLLLLMAACIFAGCESVKPVRFGEQLQEWVPLGTPVAEARRTMEAHGFDCSLVKKDNPFNHTHTDFLQCDKEEIMLHTWTAQFLITDDKVSGYG